jgi:hypothetical protein
MQTSSRSVADVIGSPRHILLLGDSILYRAHKYALKRLAWGKVSLFHAELSQPFDVVATNRLISLRPS